MTTNVNAHGGTSQWRSVFPLASIVAFAFALRVFYVFDAAVKNPIVGDINQYVLYAWNLIHFNTFSSTLPTGDAIVVADSYRGPGYPLLVAAAMELAGNAQLSVQVASGNQATLLANPTTWMTYVYLFQAALGALSVLLTLAIAGFWMGQRAALIAGLCVALWPHLVVFSGVMLSETLFGFLLLLAMWLLCEAWGRRNAFCSACAGLSFGAAYLTNPIIAVFPLLAGFALVVGQRWRVALIFIATYLIAPFAWSVRNSSLSVPAPSAFSRAAQNFVQGSWPQYLTASGSRFSNDISRAIVDAEVEEERALSQDTMAGLGLIRERMALDPSYYIWWYLVQKPYLLWDWSIRVGSGGIYFLGMKKSPYEQIAVLSLTRRVFEWLNPLFFALAALASVATVVRLAPFGCKHQLPVALAMMLFGYVTFVHAVLQAEPRYSIPYRPFEILLTVSAVAWFCQGRLLQPRHSSATAS